MKIDRLVGILVLLLRKDRVQAKELAERFGVSVRTILRDVDAINLAGIPIVTYQGAGGGISIAQGYRLDKSVLTGDDMAAIISTLRGIDGAVKSSHDILIEKLKNTLPSQQLEALDKKLKQLVIDLSPWYETAGVKEKLAVIRKAIKDARVIRFSYTDFEGRKTERTVEPHSLLLKAQNWYLCAWCRLRDDFRFFKVSRIKELAECGETFTHREAPPLSVPEDSEWYKAGNPVALELVFIKGLESLVTEWFGDDVQAADDESLLVRCTLPESDWLYGYLLSFGTGVEVISPPHIRAKLAGIAKELYERYMPQ
ncbi:MAG: helix-turn-helix transcriptional regulator [Burkholderiales bacterium]